MKQRIFSIAILAICASAMTFAQTVQENEMAVVYYRQLDKYE